jgi:hypothetical protein
MLEAGAVLGGLATSSSSSLRSPRLPQSLWAFSKESWLLVKRAVLLQARDPGLKVRSSVLAWSCSVAMNTACSSMREADARCWWDSSASARRCWAWWRPHWSTRRRKYVLPSCFIRLYGVSNSFTSPWWNTYTQHNTISTSETEQLREGKGKHHNNKNDGNEYIMHTHLESSNHAILLLVCITNWGSRN